MASLTKPLIVMTDRLISLSSIFSTAVLLLVLLTILTDVIGRFFGSPLSGSQDLTQMAMVLIVFGGMAYCEKNSGFIAVDLFERMFPPMMNRLLDIAGHLIGGLLFAAIGYTVIEAAEISQMLGLSTNILGLEKAPFQYALAGFALLTALSLLLKCLNRLLSLFVAQDVDNGVNKEMNDEVNK
ncbi:TRAP transporter small permease [Marinobacterium lutimaris]|uniref:TRAP transporter small permease protein n=1 Tax=Marinobacterium lutimaris TaxID=568106 RepID=A0A1H6DLE0_9GAMM|nr:TRAP transporter small permease [Marinobacterium lutimaris]SEG85653.1 TRAP-type C4-dicarboxylate transport system, small permease component [Marinobacterium lutimaris]